MIIIVLIAAILAGCFYSGWLGPREYPGIEEQLKDPVNIGTEIEVVYANAESVNGAKVLFEDYGYNFSAIFPEVVSFKPGLDISFAGTILDSQTVKVDNYHLHPARPLKYIYSLPAVIFVIFLLFRRYKFNWRKFLFSEK